MARSQPDSPRKAYFRQWYEKNRAKKRAYDTAWRKANPERFRTAVMRKQVRHRYGITLEEWEKIRARPCALCGDDKDVCIDHCHETKKVRGPLCRHCNAALGLMKDNPALLRKAAAYIEKHRRKK